MNRALKRKLRHTCTIQPRTGGRSSTGAVTRLDDPANYITDVPCYFAITQEKVMDEEQGPTVVRVSKIMLEASYIEDIKTTARIADIVTDEATFAGPYEIKEVLPRSGAKQSSHLTLVLADE